MQKKSEKLPLNFINYISECIIIFNQKKEIIDINKNALKILGITKPGKKKLQLNDIITEKNKELLDIINQTINSGRTKKNKEINFKKRNKEIKLLFSSMLSEAQLTADTKIIIILKDITDVWLSHVHNRKLQYQLRKNYINLLENLRQVTDSIAHEMRNPLVAIGGYANYLLKKNNSSKTENVIKYVNYIKEDSERLLNIIKQAEEYSQIKEISFAKHDISILFKNLINFAKKFSKKKAIALEISIPADKKHNVFLDKIKLQTAMQDLIKNTINLANEKSIIFVTLQYNRYDIDFHIELDSSKITDKNIKFIFNPFYSISGDVINFNFTTARRIIILHGGTIKIFKKNIHTLTFEINLPIEKRIL